VDVSGRLDARVGNLVIEFKDDLDQDIDSAKNQLRRYVYLLRKEEGIEEDFLCLATDGETFVTYETLFADTLNSEWDVELSQLTKLVTETADISQVERWLSTLFTERVHPVVEQLDDVFGVDSDTFEECLEILREAYEESKSASVHKDEWADYLQYAQGSSVDEKDELFLRHTYLASFAKLLSYMVFTRGSMPSIEDSKNVVNGTISEPFPDNLFQQDLFSWIGRVDEGDEFVEILVDRLLGFNLGRVNQDVFKKLYQDMVSYEVRHDLGEYYTPDWLAEYMINQKMELDGNDRVLDPGCGSGTFLVEAIQHKRDHSTDPPGDLVSSIPDEVVGIDIHPLAVMVAKANYVAAIEDILPYRRDRIQIPVYLADSVLFEKGLMDADIDLFGVKTRGPIHIAEEEYYLPEKAIEEPAKFDAALTITEDYVGDDSTDGYEVRLKNEFPEFEDVTGAFTRILDNITRADRDGRDSIHTFILQNFFRPLFLAEQQSFDALIGNPPWLSYRYMGDRQQEQVKDLFQDYNIYPGTSVGQMELATLFVIRCMDLYLKDEGKLGFVMPRAIFGAAQHEPIRRGEANIKFDLDLVLDLDDVEPLFNVPAAAIFATKDRELDYPVPKETFTGKLSAKNLSWADAESQLTIEDGEIVLNDGEITSWDDIPDLSRSSYHSKFHQGANLYPRKFVIAELNERATDFGFNADKPPVKTAESTKKYEKDTYKGIELSAEVESKFIYGTVLGRDLVPFLVRNYRASVVPALPDGDGYEMLETEQAASGGYPGLRDWLDQANEEWDGRSSRETVTEQFDYQLGSRVGVSGQNPNAQYKVLYPTSGTNLVGCVVNTDDVIESDSDLEMNDLIVDHKAYFYETDSEDEAYYISAILNSNVLNDMIKNLQSRGDFGERDIYRIPFEFPVPEFDASNPDHARLAELGKEGEVEAQDALGAAEDQYKATWKIREVIRESLQNEIEEIDEIIQRLIGLDD